MCGQLKCFQKSYGGTVITQKEKELSLQVICAMLPYDVYVHIRYKTGEPCYGKLTPRDIQWFIDSKIENIKPYLRPMSSMTREEIKMVCTMNSLSESELDDRIKYQKMYVNSYTIETFDLFNSHHFDYRGFIEMGLALETPEGMYE